MDYIRIKESAIKLADLIKIIPNEDKLALESILMKYKEQLNSFKNFDPTNNIFSKKELSSVRSFMISFEKNILKKVERNIEIIESKIDNEIGLEQKWQEYLSYSERLTDYFCKKNNIEFSYGDNFYKKLSKFKERSKKLKILNEEHDKLCDTYVEKIENNNEYILLKQEQKELKEKINSFQIDLELKNYIVFRRNYAQNTTLYTTSRETIMNEVINQFNKYSNEILTQKNK